MLTQLLQCTHLQKGTPSRRCLSHVKHRKSKSAASKRPRTPTTETPLHALHAQKTPLVSHVPIEMVDLAQRKAMDVCAWDLVREVKEALEYG